MNSKQRRRVRRRRARYVDLVADVPEVHECEFL